MRIWKLTPTNLTDPIWKKWSPEPIIVRAESEREARRLAVEKTVRTFPPIRYAPIPVNVGRLPQDRRSLADAL
jgi:hypothetical protein